VKGTVMKKLLVLLMTLGVLAGCNTFTGDSVPERAGNGIKKGGEAAGRGIEKGAEAAGRGIQKGGEATAEGLTTAGKWVDKKINPGDEKSEKAADR